MDNWKINEDAFYVTKDGQKIAFLNDYIREEKRITGLGKGIYTTYTYFDTYVWKEDSTNDYYFEWIPKKDENIQEVHWPSSFECNSEEGYSTIPYLQGVLIPNRYDYDYRHIAFDGQFTSCAAYMPWFSQTDHGFGYIAINETPWDSKYTIDHDEFGTRLQFVWLTSLGKMSYKRVVRYTFEKNLDYNRACKIYREYVKESGLFKTLKEKKISLPRIEELQKCSVVHTGIKTHVEKESSFYKGQNDTLHPFKEVEKQIQELHEAGAKKIYLHLDGWGNPGYDNCHPDYLPACMDAGGWKDLKSLQESLTENKDLFGLHDQYRDYYYKAKTHDENQAIQLEDGSYYQHSNWAGGKQNYLCASLAPKYVKRNYEEILKHIHLDCVYLDVFTCNEMDECFNPEHRMTRKECMDYRKACFQYMVSTNIIPSSEECSDWAMRELVFSHYGPYEFMMKEESKKKMGIPVPLFNLVYHDCFILPWPMDKKKEDYMLYALINGGIPYLIRNAPYENVDGNFGQDNTTLKEKIKRANIVQDFYQKIKDEELVAHKILDKDTQQSIFSNGIKVTINTKENTYVIEE